MKKLLLIIVITTAASAAFAQELSARMRRYPQATTAPTSQRFVRQGGLQRAAQAGNIAQAFNPFAPREYGTGEQFVENRESDPFQHPRGAERDRPIALRLFAVEF